MKVQKLSHWDRAKILYSHICCSRLFENHPDLKKDLYINRNYLKIIYHENYNPRIIEFITSTDKFEGNYWDFIQDALDNPSEVWSHYFAVQNDVFLQYIILIVTFHKHIPEKNLQEAFYKLINFDNQRTQDFATTLKLAV